MKLESGVFPQYVSLSHSSIGKSIDESEHLFIGYTFPMAICTKIIATMFRAVVDFVNFRTYVRLKRRISLRGVVLVRLEVSVTKPSIIAID